MPSPILPPLAAIALLFPRAGDGAHPFFAPLAQLLSAVPNCHYAAAAEQLTLTPLNPAGALPVTTIALADVLCPTIHFAGAQGIDLRVPGLHLQGTPTAPPTATIPASGEPGPSWTALLPAPELLQRLRGHILRIDHTGVNLPTAALTRPAWDALLRQLGGVAALYRYPEGEDWPFIVPATATEFADDIRAFVPGREPKFELVYDAHAPAGVIQLNLETDLTRDELATLLPEPYGRPLPGLEHLFHTVYLAHPWPNLWLRIDLSCRNDGPPTDWDTAEWLITAGGRIR